MAKVRVLHKVARMLSRASYILVTPGYTSEVSKLIDFFLEEKS